MFYVFHTTDITDGTFGLFTFKDRNFLFPRFHVSSIFSTRCIGPTGVG